MIWDEHPEKDEREDGIGSTELPFRQDIPIQRTQDGRNESRGNDHIETVPKVYIVMGSVVSVQLNVVSSVSSTNPLLFLNSFFHIFLQTVV